MTRSRCCLSLAFIVLPAVPAQAADPARLPDVVVTASRGESALNRTAAPVTRLDQDVLAHSKPRLISDVLDRIPGVHMVDLGNEQHSMSIRQPITTNAVYQYLEDNIPIRPIGVFNHNALNEINLTGMDSVEVMRGPASSLYGSNAAGGAVNFLTRAPSRAPEAWLGLRGGDSGYQRLDAGASAGQGDWGVMASVYHSEVRNGWRQHNDARKDALGLRLDGVTGDNSLLKTVYSYTDLDTDMSGTLGDSAWRSQPGHSDMSFTRRTDRTQRLSGSLETEWAPGHSTRLTVYVRDNAHGQIPSYTLGNCRPVAPAVSCVTNGTRNDNAYTSAGVDAQWSRPLPLAQGRLVTGLTWDHTRNRFDEDSLIVTRDSDNRYTGYTVGGKRRHYLAVIDNPSWYAQGEFLPHPRLSLTTGLRYDRVAYDFHNHLTPSAATGAADEQRDFEHLSPRLGLTLSSGRDQEIFLNLSEGFVPPEVSQLYASLAVPALSEAVFRNVDLGWRQRFGGRGHVEATLYRLDGNDEIVSYTLSTAPLVRENRNAGQTRHTGLELGGRWAFTERLSLWGSATAARHEFRRYQPAAAENYDGNAMPQAPRHTAALGLDWSPAAGWTLSPELVRVGPYWLDLANSVPYDGHTLLNLRARWTRDAWEVFGQLLNAADAGYAHSASSSYKTGARNPDSQDSYTPGDPRTLVAGIQYRWR